MTQTTATIWIQILVAIAAVISAIGTAIGIFVQSRNVSRQINATLISAYRQKRIDDLRKWTAKLMSNVWAFKESTRDIPSPTDSDQEMQKLIFDYKDSANYYLFRVQLLIDPSKSKEAILIEKLQSVVTQMELDSTNAQAINNQIDQIVKCESKSIERETRRIKAGH